MSSSSAFQFTRALVRAIDPSLVKEALRMGGQHVQPVVNLALATQQHESMVTHLLSAGLKVIHLPSDGLPDSVFIEDTVVIVKNTAMITVPGAISRRLETPRVKQTLLEQCGDLKVVEQSGGTLDGGDVLFTGHEFFVGRSYRTNDEGISALQSAFPHLRVTAIDINFADAGVLHLKSACSMCGDGQILTGGTVGLHIAQNIEKASPQRYRIKHVEDAAASNCVYVNGHLFRRSAQEFPNSAQVLANLHISEHTHGRHEKQPIQKQIEASELAKVDGALTCCSVLF